MKQWMSCDRCKTGKRVCFYYLKTGCVKIFVWYKLGNAIFSHGIYPKPFVHNKVFLICCTYGSMQFTEEGVYVID